MVKKKLVRKKLGKKKLSKKKYFSISTKNLRVNTILNFDIYLQHKDSPVLFRKGNNPFTEEALGRLIEHKIESLLISKEDRGKYEKYSLSVKDDSCSHITNEGFVPPIFDKSENVEKYYKMYFNFFPIGRETLVPGSKVNFNVYEKKGIDVELYFGPEKQNRTTDIIPDDIQKSDLPLVIRNTDIPLYKEYLQDIAHEYLKLSDIPEELKCSIVQENSKLIVKEILEGPLNAEKVKKSSKVVESLVDTVFYVENKFYNLLKITSDDYYAYTHALNVCTISIGLGMAIKLEKTPDIMELGLGALLHDIGKSMISPYIVNKPGRLTKEEFLIMQTHIVEGKKLLEKGNGKTQQNVFYPITQHHERLSGNGYPSKLKGEQIHLFGRITSIANFYDNLTTARPYKKAYTPYEALALMAENKENFDHNLLVVFIKMIGLQTLN
jgi:HD-GYP domain-containing protein (c-di-GMP phosphodiesterase class II)